MRITTLGVLAAFAMTLTSATVWSLTGPAEAAPNPNQVGSLLGNDAPKPDDTPTPETPPPVDRSVFVSGKQLMLEGRLGHAKLLADQPGQTFLLAEVRSELDPSDPFTNAAAPINLAIVIDHSGSMAGQRERNAFDAAEGMIRRLREGDTVSVVAYADEARLIVPVTTIDSQSRERVIADMRLGTAESPKGHTCVSCGIDLGRRTLERRRPGIARMLLLSDGEANRGVRDEEGIRVLARQARNEGVTISSIGVDVDYNERLMSAIARESNGHHYFSETGSNLSEIFDQEFQSLVHTVATEGKLVVELAPGVRVAQVFDRSYQQVDRRVIVPMGSFAAGEAKTLLLRLEVPESPIGERPIASLSLTYTTPGAVGAAQVGEPGECFGELAAQMTSAAAEVSPLDAIVLARLTRSETSLTLQEANLLIAQGRVSEAQAVVDKQLQTIATNKQTVGRSRGGGGLIDAFGRDLDGDFASQAEALDDANAGIAEAAAEPTGAPAAARPAKVQIRENAAKADAFSL